MLNCTIVLKGLWQLGLELGIVINSYSWNIIALNQIAEPSSDDRCPFGIQLSMMALLLLCFTEDFLHNNDLRDSRLQLLCLEVRDSCVTS